MNMSLKDIRFYYAILLRRLPYFLAIVLVVTAVGGTVAYMLPAIYSASAKILVESPQISADLAHSTVSNNAVQQLDIYQQELMTREHLLDLAQKLDVYGVRRSELTDADIVEDLRDRTTFELVSDARSGGATVFSVAFEDRDPTIAARVVNEFVSLILKKNVNVRTAQASETLQFFADEVSRLGRDLSTLDSKILEFKNANRDALPDSLDFRRMQQSSQQERLQMLEWEETGLRTRRNNLIQMFEATGQIAKEGPMTPDQQTLLDLRRSLSDQLVLFSESSPNIVALRTRIASLEDTIRNAAPDDGEGGENVKAPPSQLDIQLSDIDQRLVFIGRERKSINKSLASLSKSIAATPANEGTLNALSRTRENTQTQYSAAVAGYAQAATGKQIEVDAKGERFSVVEPAAPPHEPVRPKRKRLAAASMAAGLGLGAAFIVLLELLNKSIRRPSELVDALQIQPLATIPFIDVKERKPAYARYIAGMLMLAGLGQLLFISSIGNP